MKSMFVILLVVLSSGIAFANGKPALECTVMETAFAKGVPNKIKIYTGPTNYVDFFKNGGFIKRMTADPGAGLNSGQFNSVREGIFLGVVMVNAAPFRAAGYLNYGRLGQYKVICGPGF